jgi:hypothetical protein
MYVLPALSFCRLFLTILNIATPLLFVFVVCFSPLSLKVKGLFDCTFLFNFLSDTLMFNCFADFLTFKFLATIACCIVTCDVSFLFV